MRRCKVLSVLVLLGLAVIVHFTELPANQAYLEALREGVWAATVVALVSMVSWLLAP